MQIFRRLPFRDAPHTIEVAGEDVPIRAYQIVVWVSLSPGELLADDAPRFPAVLDTGHSHNFSIREDLLLSWAGLGPEDLSGLGSILVNQQEVPLRVAQLWIHRNRPGAVELLPRPFRLEVPQGIAVYPAAVSAAPRLPLLGLRSLIRSKLRLRIDGGNLSVSLGS